jgi:hypothetical protein
MESDFVSVIDWQCMLYLTSLQTRVTFFPQSLQSSLHSRKSDVRDFLAHIYACDLYVHVSSQILIQAFIDVSYIKC